MNAQTPPNGQLPPTSTLSYRLNKDATASNLARHFGRETTTSSMTESVAPRRGMPQQTPPTRSRKRMTFAELARSIGQRADVDESVDAPVLAPSSAPVAARSVAAALARMTATKGG